MFVLRLAATVAWYFIGNSRFLNSWNDDFFSRLPFHVIDNLDRQHFACFGERAPEDDDFAGFGVVLCGNPLVSIFDGDGIPVRNPCVSGINWNFEGELKFTSEERFGQVGESNCNSFVVRDACNVPEFVCRGAPALGAGLLVEIEPSARRFAEPVKRGGIVRVFDADVPLAVELHAFRMEFEKVDAVGLVARDGEDSEGCVAYGRNARNFLRYFHVADLCVPVDAVLVLAVRE